MKMISEMFHPNIEKDGLVNMSILHRPGYDMLNEQEPIE
jgi:ubiquitin-protein ligase